MEKEAGILICEMKISLTFQKQAYAVFFVVILSLVRGVTYSNDIGIALEAPMAILAFTFCADTYTQEIASKRSESWRLCPMKKRMHVDMLLWNGRKQRAVSPPVLLVLFCPAL